MALTKDDKKYINDVMKVNNRELLSELMIWMSQHFPTKKEVGEIVDEKLITIKYQISDLQNAVSTLDSRFTEITTFQQAEIQNMKVRIGLD